MPYTAPSPLTQYPVSHELVTLQSQLAATSMRQLFTDDLTRFDRYSLAAAGLFLDYAKHLINDDVMAALVKLAEQASLPAAITAMYAGQPINTTEQRAVLHTALRRFDGGVLQIAGDDVMLLIRATRARLRALTMAVHSGAWRGYTGKAIRHLVNIGIGGSYLGLKTVTQALKPYHKPGLTHHYVANIDPAVLAEVLSAVDPETTLFIIASKSFNTLETLQNAQAARRWLVERGCSEADIGKHFIALSTNLPAVAAFGVTPENTLPLWDWVGGRYSLWSSIGLMISLVVGYDRFERLLAGAWAMDQHFQQAPLANNMPVILGLLGIWYQNYFGAETQAVIAYDHGLRDLPRHLQQVDMESNGKRVRHDGTAVDYMTGAIMWGGTGTDDQHAYHQLLHQGTRLVPVDFIVSAATHQPIADQHPWLFANALAQSQAMMQGITHNEAYQALLAAGLPAEAAKQLAAHKVMPGNRPNSMIVLEQVTPETLGALLALYEHKVFVQSVLWQINAFDQWGVELGKVLSDRLFQQLKTGAIPAAQDSSTSGLIRRFQSIVRPPG